MSQTITISKSLIEELLGRVERLEKMVLRKSPIMKAIDTYEEEKHKGTLKKLKTVDELFD